MLLATAKVGLRLIPGPVRRLIIDLSIVQYATYWHAVGYRQGYVAGIDRQLDLRGVR